MKMLDKLTPSQKRIINILAFCVIIGVGFMLIQPSSTPRRAVDQTPTYTANVIQQSARSYEEAIEENLATILNQIAGVKNANVFVTLERSSEIVVAENITTEDRTINEDDRNGATKLTLEKRETRSIVTLPQEGSQKEVPLVLKEYEPVIKGVIVVAKGADDPDLRLQIARAVQTALQISMYRIDVFAQ